MEEYEVGEPRYKTIAISKENWKWLTIMKAEMNAKSIDEVITVLLEPYIIQKTKRGL